MPFRVVRGVGRRMGVLDAGGDRRREGAILGVNLVSPIVSNGYGDALFTNYFGEDLFIYLCEQSLCQVTEVSKQITAQLYRTPQRNANTR